MPRKKKSTTTPPEIEDAGPQPNGSTGKESVSVLTVGKGKSDPAFTVEFPLDVNQLAGNLRDWILDRLRQDQDNRPWNERSEAEQVATVMSCDTAVRRMIERACDLISGRGFPVVRGILDSVTIKEGIKAVLKLDGMADARHDLFDRSGAVVSLVLVDPERFMGTTPAKVRPDQSELELPPNPPALEPIPPPKPPESSGEPLAEAFDSGVFS